MLDAAPLAEDVMGEVLEFTRGLPLVAHNAAFDRCFWLAEAQRLYPQLPNHRLGTLSACFILPRAGRAHRALSDAETTAHLLLKIQNDVSKRFQHELESTEVDHSLLLALQSGAATQMQRCVARHARPGASAGA